MPIELRKWFQIFIGVLSLLLSILCLLAIRSALPESATLALAALCALFIGAISGFYNLFRVFLPLIMLRLWPGIEKNHG